MARSPRDRSFRIPKKGCKQATKNIKTKDLAIVRGITVVNDGLGITLS